MLLQQPSIPESLSLQWSPVLIFKVQFQEAEKAPRFSFQYCSRKAKVTVAIKL